MSTSGILLIAKTSQIHKLLQKQFLQRTVKKRYIALLDGVLKQTEGTIELPIRVDLDDRPRQVVCYQYGKQAKTQYRVVSINNQQSRVKFYPITGRTHQLRIHAAHNQGLNIPIVGDELYGKRAERLMLHAEKITFKHPISHKKMIIKSPCPF
jgi:tRNA pseudouridine32 synthase/23S rRNA pseudouridine746 synthase